MSKHFFLLLVFLLALSLPSWAQRRMKQMDSDKQAKDDEMESYEKKPWTERLVYGGNLWLGIGSSSTMIYVQPLVGYRVTDKFIAGGGFTYVYLKQEYYVSSNQTISVSDNIYGLNFFARQTLFGPLFAHAEYQPMNFTSRNYFGDTKRIWTNALFLGGGINQSFGKSGSGAYFLVLYDVLWRDRDPNPGSFDRSYRPSPVDIRIGFFF